MEFPKRQSNLVTKFSKDLEKILSEHTDHILNTLMKNLIIEGITIEVLQNALKSSPAEEPVKPVKKAVEKKTPDPATQCQRVKKSGRCTGKQKLDKVIDAAHVYRVCDSCFKVKTSKLTDYVNEDKQEEFPAIISTE